MKARTAFTLVTGAGLVAYAAHVAFGVVAACTYRFATRR